MSKTYLITPTNEGQELNYTETLKSPKNQALARAQELRDLLAPILKEGMIGCQVEDQDGNVIRYYPAV